MFFFSTKSKALKKKIFYFDTITKEKNICSPSCISGQHCDAVVSTVASVLGSNLLVSWGLSECASMSFDQHSHFCPKAYR